MASINRRKFIYSTALISGIPGVLSSLASSAPEKSEGTANDIPVGVIVSADNPEKDLKIVRDLGYPVCQLNIRTYSPELAKQLTATLEKYKIKAMALICGGPGVDKYNFTEGPSTIGLVPRENRAARVERLKNGMNFCKAAGIPAIQTHFGFIPENPNDVLYVEFVETMKPLGEYALKNDIDIYFETGQETPVTLLRAILDIGTGNLFVNYDTANLIMYGKSNPVDGLKVLGRYVRSLHAKDGKYPTNPYELGKEVPIPTGDVDFPAVISFLKKLNFKGGIIIEYELADNTSEYLLKTKEYLEKLITSK
ncbi:MAG TPA: sugar phosphate isomerase/epimerase family protein [Bacteroidales bacterium]|nr:sugar phosphate isomerase/epimerase family protein [Bacteroidales bacterium]